MDDKETAFYVAAVEKRGGPPTDPGAGGSGAVGSTEPPSIDDFDDGRDDQGPGDPRVEVAMET